MDASWTELLKQVGFYGSAAFLVWRFATRFINKFFDAQQEQLAKCHEEFGRQAQIFAKALDKRDEQTNEIITHLHQQTATMKTIADQTGKILTKVAV